jgi:phycobilisome core linker protein
MELGNSMSRLFKLTACVPSKARVRTARELQNTYFTKLVEYDRMYPEMQRISRQGGKIIKVELYAGRPGQNAGVVG